MPDLKDKLREQIMMAVDHWFDGHEGCHIRHNGQVLYGSPPDGHRSDRIEVVDKDLNVVATFILRLEEYVI